MSSLVLTERQGSLWLITLNRPKRHNSLVPELLEELMESLAAAEMNPEIRAVVLQANGPSFSTGGDLAGFRDHLDSLDVYADRIVGLLHETIRALMALNQPVVTAVQGAVTGGSLGLVMASDIVLVAPEASFTPYYSVVGFSPDGGWTAMLPALIGLRRTAGVLLLNRTISPQQAVDWGLANRMVASEDLRREAIQVAHEFAAMQPGSLLRTKVLLNRWFDDANRKLDVERINFVEEISREETRSSMLAFLEQMAK